MDAYRRDDTIVALATPHGVGALAVIRVSGRDLISFLSKLTGGIEIVPRYVTYTPIYSHLSGELLDNCVITYFKSPHSYTGEDVVEISCHGGDYIPKSILSDLYQSGIRTASPGEFSFRAFMNGKMDLVQAESVSSIISAKTEMCASVNLTNLSGLLSRNIANLKLRVLELLSLIEHEMDFSEDEIAVSSKKDILKKLRVISKTLKSSLKTAGFGKVISSGVRVVLMGRPNSGKSNLFNNILGHERAIVSPFPGTTRDTIEAWFDLDGFPICLVDTAGVWETEDYLESLGIEKTISELNNADIVLFVDDKDPLKVFKELHVDIDSKKVLFVKTKEDLTPTRTTTNIVSYTSSKKDVGFNKLLTTLSTTISGQYANYDRSNPVLATSRQRLVMIKADNILDSTTNLVKDGVSMDVVASSLRDFVDQLKEFVGEISPDDIIDKIFSSFCVGK